jgi:hypothetical protein
MLDTLSNAIFESVQAVLSFFPDSPFAILQEMGSTEYSEWLGYLNWFIPIYTFVAIIELWLAGIAIYYVLQIVLRWIKAIE